jgi:hypothetical protein
VPSWKWSQPQLEPLSCGDGQFRVEKCPSAACQIQLQSGKSWFTVTTPSTGSYKSLENLYKLTVCIYRTLQRDVEFTATFLCLIVHPVPITFQLFILHLWVVQKLRKIIMHYRIVLKDFSVMNGRSISSTVLLTALKAGKVLFSLAACRMRLILTRSKTWCILDLWLNFIVGIKGRIHWEQVAQAVTLMGRSIGIVLPWSMTNVFGNLK